MVQKNCTDGTAQKIQMSAKVKVLKWRGICLHFSPFMKNFTV